MAVMDFFKGVMKPVAKARRHFKQALFMDGTMPVFSQFGDDVYASDVVQAAVECIATELGKLQPKHIRRNNENSQENVNGSLSRLLRVAPNELMTMSDFIQKTVWLLFKNYNAFIYPTYDLVGPPGRKRREYTGLYPLDPSQVEFLQDEESTLFVKFSFTNGTTHTCRYSDVIHLRKRFSSNSIMGGGLNGRADNHAILKVLEINDTLLQGIDKGIKSSLAIRGIIKLQTMLDSDSLKEERRKFEQSLKENESGILPMDLKGEYQEIKVNPKIIDKDTLEFLQNKILNHYGVSVPILSGDFTDEQYQAFYEKTLEPLIISLGQAFTKTLFTDRELDHGNEVIFYPQMLLFTNTKNKAAIADILGNRGALTNNQLLQLFGYPPYQGGDVRVMSLNYIDAELANDYQLEKAGTQKNKESEGSDNERETET